VTDVLLDSFNSFVQRTGAASQAKTDIIDGSSTHRADLYFSSSSTGIWNAA